MSADCTRCASALEDGDLRCAICALPVPFTEPSPASPYAKVLRCRVCAAAVAFSAEHQAPKCAFCASTMEIEQPTDPVEVARVRVPFSVDRMDAEASLRGWLGNRGWFAPAELRDGAVVESIQPLYWAGWLVDARARVAWTADSNEGAKRSAWAPHAGDLAMAFDAIVVPASRGLERGECHLLVPYYDIGKALPIDAATVADLDAPVESFDTQRSAARDIVQQAIERVAKTRVEPHVPGRRFRKVHVACLVESQTTERVALPAWVLAYRYREKLYRAIVHGQRREVVFGNAPIDLKKVLLVVGAILATAAVIAAIVIAR
ncbi:MAG: zinc ribbon domain-containing protein [Kofleriaceae bacterium]